MSLDHFPEGYFGRHDERDDVQFYADRPRQSYLGEGATSALKGFLREHLPQNGDYLDLLSGWKSYIPEEIGVARVVGLGLIQAEMAENPQLDEVHAFDLNRKPRLPFDDERFDACLCVSSIQYVIRPVELFEQVKRVLKPGGPFFLAFSSGCFPAKAIAIWLITNAGQRQALVKRYFRASGGWSGVESWVWPGSGEVGREEDPLYLVWARKAKGRPRLGQGDHSGR